MLRATGYKFEHLVLRTALGLIDVKDTKTQNGGKDVQKVRLVGQELERLRDRPMFLRYMAEVDSAL